MPNPIPFAEDKTERPYAAEAVTRFFHAMVAVDRVLKRFRTGFLGKVSPVHLFWGSFDLAVTRFSGRTAPLHPGGIPALPDMVTREAYSHEVSSAGFWPGDARIDFPAFYSYAYPAPEGCIVRDDAEDVLREAHLKGISALGEFRGYRPKRGASEAAAPHGNYKSTACGTLHHSSTRLYIVKRYSSLPLFGLRAIGQFRCADLLRKDI